MHIYYIYVNAIIGEYRRTTWWLCAVTQYTLVELQDFEKKSKISVSRRTTTSVKTNYLQALVRCCSAFGRRSLIIVVVEVVVFIMTLSSDLGKNSFKLYYYLGIILLLLLVCVKKKEWIAFRLDFQDIINNNTPDERYA